MRKIYILIVSVLTLFALASCDEDKLEPSWEYHEPVPEITNGPSLAQKMCYDLYKRYDLRVYYNLSDDEALRSEKGIVQENPIIWNNREAIPMQAADEGTAEKFLKLLTSFYSLLPDDLVCHSLFKRQVLVKVNPGISYLKNDKGYSYWLNTYAEDSYGYLCYGYQSKADTPEDDRFESDLKSWKWNICYEFFKGYANGFKGFSKEKEFGSISKGFYNDEIEEGVESCLSILGIFNEELGKTYGFVHPLGAEARSNDVIQDWGSIVAWILTEPEADRANDLKQNYRLKVKYDMILDYCKTTYGIDLEDLSIKWINVTI